MKTWADILDRATVPYSWPEQSCVALACDVVEMYCGARPDYAEFTAMREARALARARKLYGSVGACHAEKIGDVEGMRIVDPIDPARPYEVGDTLWIPAGILYLRPGLEMRIEHEMLGRLLVVLPDGWPYAVGTGGLVAVDITRAPPSIILRPPYGTEAEN